MSNYALEAVGRYKSNQKFYTFSLVVLLLLSLIAIFGFYASGKPIASLSSTAVINYVTITVMAMCTFLLNRKVIKDLTECTNVIDELQKKSIENDKLQWELDAYRNENNDLRDALLESERGRKEAERLAKQYWEMLPEDKRKLAEDQRKLEEDQRKLEEDQRKLEDAIEEMLELNSSQHTSSQRTSEHSRDISGCPQQQEYPSYMRPDV